MSLVMACPFCGERDDSHNLRPNSDNVGKWGWIECSSCGARGPDVRTGYLDPEAWRGDAIGEWNRRA